MEFLNANRGAFKIPPALARSRAWNAAQYLTNIGIPFPISPGPTLQLDYLSRPPTRLDAEQNLKSKSPANRIENHYQDAARIGYVSIICLLTQD